MLKASVCGAAFAIALIIGIIMPVKRQKYRDRILTAGVIAAPIDAILAHRSPKPYVKLLGRTYSNVRGRVPYFLDVPQGSLRVFVITRGGNGILIFFDRISGASFEIDAGKTDFGKNIGSTVQEGRPGSDTIQVSSEMVFILNHNSSRRTEKMVVDLKTKEILERFVERRPPRDPAASR